MTAPATPFDRLGMPAAQPPAGLTASPKASQESARELFGDFAGQTFFGQLIASMRKSVDKPAYFHGGRGEEVFQGQLDQILTEKMTEVSKETFVNPLIDQFMLQRR